MARFHVSVCRSAIARAFHKIVGCSLPGWVESGLSPFIQDHDGLRWSLLDLPLAAVRRRAEQAWLRYVGHAHRHRPSMADLQGIDCSLLRLSVKGMSSLNVARTQALQAGAFVFDAAHANFDLTKTGLCSRCGVEDNKFHRVCECPRFELQPSPHQWVVSKWRELPTCLTHHLLAPCNPHVPGVLSGLLGVVHSTGIFFCECRRGTVNHLFTDGSCFQHLHEDLSLATLLRRQWLQTDWYLDWRRPRLGPNFVLCWQLCAGPLPSVKRQPSGPMPCTAWRFQTVVGWARAA